MPYENVDQARLAARVAHSEFWKLYMKDPKSPDTEVAHERSKAIRADVLVQFGKPDPKHPDCTQCLSASVFGGPSHEASPRCRSGKHPHCSCDTCW